MAEKRTLLTPAVQIGSERHVVSQQRSSDAFDATPSSEAVEQLKAIEASFVSVEQRLGTLRVG